MTFEESVFAVVASLRRGEVISYGEVAAEAGYPGAARAVGNALAMADGLPWWRVVRSDGRLPAGKEAEAARHLTAEGVTISSDGTRVMRR